MTGSEDCSTVATGGSGALTEDIGTVEVVPVGAGVATGAAGVNGTCGAGGVGGAGGTGIVVGVLLEAGVATGVAGALGMAAGAAAVDVAVGEDMPTPGVGKSDGLGAAGAGCAVLGTSTGVGSGGMNDCNCSFIAAFSWSALSITGRSSSARPASFASSLSSKSLMLTGATVGSCNGWITRVLSEAGFGALPKDFSGLAGAAGCGIEAGVTGCCGAAGMFGIG